MVERIWCRCSNYRNIFRYLNSQKIRKSMDNDWKKRLGVVYSTNPDYHFQSEDQEEEQTLSPGQQKLYVKLDRKNRKGKTVTLVEGFVGREEDLKSLGKELKSKCGVGGSVRDGEILLQGDFRERVISLLKGQGYNVKRSGG
jgi:translation initiation factor 1